MYLDSERDGATCDGARHAAVSGPDARETGRFEAGERRNETQAEGRAEKNRTCVALTTHTGCWLHHGVSSLTSLALILIVWQIPETVVHVSIAKLCTFASLLSNCQFWLAVTMSTSILSLFGECFDHRKTHVCTCFFCKFRATRISSCL